MSFCRPAARPPLRPSLPPSFSDKTPGRWTDSPFESFPPSLPVSFALLYGSVPRPCSPYPFASFYPTPLRHSSPLTRPSLLFILCATLHHRSCRPVVPCPPPPSPFCLPFPLAFSLSLVFLVVHVFVRFLISLSFFLPSSLRQATPKIPTGRSTSDSSLERAFEKKGIFARSARDEKTPK